MKAYIREREQIPFTDHRDFFLLGLNFLSGLLLGAWIACHWDNSIILTQRMASPSVSVTRLIAGLLFPFLLSWAAFRLWPGLLFPVCFSKAFVFSFVHTLFALSCGTSGWLARWIFLFSDCAALPVLYGFWINLLLQRNRICFFLPLSAICLGILDLFWFQPFGAAVLS